MPFLGHIALVTGLVSSSYFTFANIGGAYFGVMPTIARGQMTLPVAEILALREAFYSVAMTHMAGRRLNRDCWHRPAYRTSAGPLRNLLAAGAVAGYTVALYTIFFLLPLNNQLIATLRANSVKPMEPIEQQRVLDQLDQWRSMHKLRIALGLVSWVASTSVLLASDPIIRFVFSIGPWPLEY